MRQLTVAALALALVGLAGMARAEDKASPNGTWKWTVSFGGQDRNLAVKLKADGEKLTGKYISPNGTETDIEDGKYKDGEVSFKVTREQERRQTGHQVQGQGERRQHQRQE